MNAFVDYLNSQGYFNNPLLFKGWKLINSTAYSYEIKTNGSYYEYLELNKSDQAVGSYDDGLYYYFGDKKPQHVTFMMQTDNQDVESCDLRLTSIDQNATQQQQTFTKLQWQDVAFFRFGYFYYQKLNLANMVKKFKNNTWYKIDLVIDWDGQAVTIYVDNQQLASDKFFTMQKTVIRSANTVILYNLTPGTTCRIKNLLVCEERCDYTRQYVFAMGTLMRSLSLGLVSLGLTLYYIL